MNVIIRVDASVVIGSGHVMRCLTLADKLKTKGAEIIFITRAHQGHMIDKIRAHDYKAIMLSEPEDNFRSQEGVAHASWLGDYWRNDAQETIGAIDPECEPDWLVVDHYGIDARWHVMLRDKVKKILVIDDLADRKLDCDLLLDQTYGRKNSDYKGIVPLSCRLLLGPKYAQLREEFNKNRKKSFIKRESVTSVKSVLVAMGGTDPDNATGLVLEALSLTGLNVNVNVVLGDGASNLTWLSNYIETMKISVDMHIGTTAMSKLMLKSDLAIGAAGTTSWERCCLGLPTIVITTATNQILIANELSNAGAIKLLGNSVNVSAELIAETILDVTGSSDALKNLSLESFKICDGRGAERVAREFLQ